MKFRKILAAMLTMALLAGCGGNTDMAEIEALLDQAKTTMATVESMSAEMTMEMDMGMNGEVIETTTLARIRSQQDPLKMAMEMSMVMSDGTAVDQMKMYAAEEDGHLHTYMSTADIWYAETLEMDELSQYNADENMDLYLDNITDFKSAGKEDINGIQTTKISGNKQYCWGGPDAELGYYQETSGELNVSISGSGSFTIWGIGLIE